MRAEILAESMRICVDAAKKRRAGREDNCEGCMYHKSPEYREFTCKKLLILEAAQLMCDMAGDIKTMGGCTMCTKYDVCTKDTKGSDVVMCADFAYPERGYRVHNLAKRKAPRP